MSAQILGTPPLRKKWQDAKKLSDDAAVKSKEDKKLAELHKNKMKGALGPDLEAWPKLYPKWDKLQSEKIKIDNTLKTYTDAVTNSGLSDAVKKPMATALKEIKTAMALRLEQAEELVKSDLKLGIKQSKHAITPIIVFQQDVAQQVAAKAGKTKLKPTRIYLEAILSDDKVLKNVPDGLDNAYLAEHIKFGAGFETVIDDLAKLLISVDNMEVKAAEKKFEEGMDKIIAAALERAAKPCFELTGVRADYRMYVIKKGATLTIAVVGVIASTVSLAATPFTGGVSTVAGIIGIIKSINTITTEVANATMKTEVFVVKVTGEIQTLYTQYVTASKTVVGVGEMAKTAVNSLVGPFFTTIKSAKTNCDQVKDRVNGLFVRTNDYAVELGALLTDQQTLQKELSSYEQSTKNQLAPEEIKKFLALHAKVEQSAPGVDKLIKNIQELHKRVENNKGAFVMLSQALDQLAVKEPTWSKVGQILIQVATSVGFLVAGNVNVPEPLEYLKLTKTIAEDMSRVLEPLEAAKELGEGLNDLIKKRKK